MQIGDENPSRWRPAAGTGARAVPAPPDTREYTPEVLRWERDCIVRAQAGDAEAFDALVQRYAPRIYAHVFHLVRNREEAEDVTQEAFIRAYRFLNRFDASRPFRNWLYTIATNTGLNALRKRKRRLVTVPIDEVTDGGNSAESMASDESPAQQLERSELADHIAQAVRRLPETTAALIQLCYHEGMTIREAAEILDMQESAAKVALFRGRKALREWLMEEEDA